MRLLIALALWLAVLAAPAGAVDGADCGATASLNQAGVECVSDETRVKRTIDNPPPGTRYKVQINCGSDVLADQDVCANPRVCASPPGSVLYDVLRSTDDGVTFVKVSEACLTNPPAGTPPVITPGLVADAFKAIAWPASDLQIQPPGGRTLVSLATNFFTTNTGPRTQTVPLLGQQVEIEATPTSWTWDHGDNTTQTTTTPGRAYPALDITHTYTTAGTGLAPRLDTTYSGRYRINTSGWITIPATVTITGTTGQLAVVTARPQLIGAD